MVLNEGHNPHDVAALLKEYFRDLPEPLLTRDLYSPLIATRKIKDDTKRLKALGLLVYLLPLPNRDTFWALCKHLARIVEHSKDTVDNLGNTLPGNKMDWLNLATLFGPNILHKSKVSDKEFKVDTAEQAEHSKEVVEIVKEIMENVHELYQVTASNHDETIRLLMETEPEIADAILKQLANEVVIEADLDTSSSVFDDCDSSSIPHSPSSDADLLSHSRAHQSLRTSYSAEPFTPVLLRKPGIANSIQCERRTFSSSDDRPTIRVQCEQSPAELRNVRSSRLSALKLSRGSASPEVTLRPHIDVRLERPYSEGFPQSLSIPCPGYLRENSTSSGYIPSTNSPSGSDNSIQWANQSPESSKSSSPHPLHRTSSQSRPLNFNDDATVGSTEWQRERWRHWELIAADTKKEGIEQETLV